MKTNQSNNMGQRQEYILEFLRNEGYRPTIDEDDDISFQLEGRWWYYISLDGNDEMFYRIFKGEFWKLDTVDEQKMALQASSSASGEIKAAKVFLNNNRDNVVASLESFHRSTIDFTLVFERSLSALTSVVENFASEMNRLEKMAEEDKEILAGHDEFSQTFNER